MSVRKWILYSRSDRCRRENGTRPGYRENRYRAEELAEERILDVLIPPVKTTGDRPNSSRNRPLLVRHPQETA